LNEIMIECNITYGSQINPRATPALKKLNEKLNEKISTFKAFLLFYRCNLCSVLKEGDPLECN